MAAESHSQTEGAEASGAQGPAKTPPRRGARGRGRGGLGRGLGALIPDAQAEVDAGPARPLDVLFPDLTGGKTSGGKRQRGGSARDLLAPRVQRDTVASAASASGVGDGTGTAPAAGGDLETASVVQPSAPGKVGEAEADGGNLDGTAQGQSENVSRETASGEVSAEDFDGSTVHSSVVGGGKASQPTSASHEAAVPSVAEGLPSGADSSANRTKVAAVSVPRETGRDEASAKDSGGSADRGTSGRDGAPGPDANVSRETAGGAHTGDGSLEAGRSGREELQEVPGATFGMVPPEWVIPNLKQPRTVFEPEELKELAASVAEVGILQPIVLRRITESTLQEEGQRERLREALEEQPEARYEIIMGERRWRASRIAGLAEVPAIIRTTEEDALLRDALLENLHRVQLNPLEEAAAYSQLLEDFECTQEELSRRIARSRPQIANTLRLLKLPSSVQRQLAAGVLSAGHARALLGLDSPAAMEALAARIIAEGLSVRATEEQVKFGKQGKARPKRVPVLVPVEAQQVADSIAGLLDTSVSVSVGAKRGRLVIDFADQADLDRIAQALGADIQ